MVDMHSHILAGVDDGPETLDEAVRMLRKAVDEGLTDIIATSHAYNPHFHVGKAAVEKKLLELQEVIDAHDIPLRLHSGQELRIQDRTVEVLETGEALTLAQSRYALIELPSSNIPNFTVPLIQKLMNQNIIPIIAHPERNKAIAEKPARLERLISHGALAQITSGSVAGHFGKSVQRVSQKLIKSNLIHFYGSDVHNLNTRPFLYNEGLDVLDKSNLHDYVDLFLENNARILEHKDAIILEPNLVDDKKWWRMFA